MNQNDDLTQTIVQDLGIRIANLTIETSALQARLNAALRRIQELEAAPSEAPRDDAPTL